MKNIGIVPVMAKCAVLCAVWIIAACEPYTCVDGTLISGPAGQNSSVACTQPAPPTCTNGKPDLGKLGTTTGHDADQCASCDYGFILNASQQCRPALTSVYNVSDEGSLQLRGATSVATAVVGETTYLFATANRDHAVSVFSVDPGGARTLVPIDFAVDSQHADYQLGGAFATATAVVESTTYLFVGGALENSPFAPGGYSGGVSVFSVGTDGKLASVDNVSDTDLLRLDEVLSLTTAVVDGATYLFAAGHADSGISVFSVGTDGKLTLVQNIDDDATLELRGIRAVTTAVIGGTTFLFAAGSADGGISVFWVGADGKLASVDNVTDDANLKLNAVADITTAVAGNTTYLFAAAYGDAGVSVFSVGADGKLTPINQGNLPNISGAISVATMVMGDNIYLFVAGAVGDEVNVFSVGTDGVLALVQSIGDNADIELNGVASVATAAIGNTTYLFAAANLDSGISVFAIAK